MSQGTTGIRATAGSRAILDRTVRRLTVAIARRIRVGRLTIVLPDGSRHAFGRPGSQPTGEMHIDDTAALVRMLLGGETGAGEAYMDGHWSSPDLPGLLRLAALNREALALSAGWWRIPLQVPRTIAHRMRRNSVDQARRNITAHYDLGNDFYRLFLDETMTYSCAVFASPDQSLADAQRNKYRVMAERAGLAAGMHVLEIGTGWGGFAVHAATHYGCHVTTTTISPRQHEFAQRRVKEAGLEDRVTVLVDDYRDLEGTFDKIIAIEMIEAVDWREYDTFFAHCRRLLDDAGALAMQAIAVRDESFDRIKLHTDFIKTAIFPGGCLPSVRALKAANRKSVV